MRIRNANPFRIRIFLFLSYSFGIETIYTFTHSRGSLENHTRPDSRPKWAKSIPAKTLPFRAAQTYMACIRENPPPRGRGWGCQLVFLANPISRLAVKSLIVSRSFASVPNPVLYCILVKIRIPRIPFNHILYRLYPMEGRSVNVSVASLDPSIFTFTRGLSYIAMPTHIQIAYATVEIHH